MARLPWSRIDNQQGARVKEAKHDQTRDLGQAPETRLSQQSMRQDLPNDVAIQTSVALQVASWKLDDMESGGLHVETFGIILATENFDACVAFYCDVLGLPVWFRKASLVCVRLGDGYLMLETGGHSHGRIKTERENPVTLRFNVRDVRAAANQLRSQGVNVTVREFDWGTVGTFCDPDGNIGEMKNADDPYFEVQ